MKSLYEDLKDAGVLIDHHESDLYFQSTNESRKILAKHVAATPGSLVIDYFSNQRPPALGEQWISVAFRYDPFWDAVEARRIKQETD